ncbi:MAG: nuclear transport factor 2 family protein [Parasphingorhabdus sp.]|jgi:ketosteroid isomerase-like protein|uniref:nuclear transport factor 2 family protein n=1 Tax=Parasphingorhabdus sp. TaxID=2709688 RepID=UPI003003A570|tara:strand:+ start:4101 stop:4574 length:474 start_codon:yes stop_codon:yes gene_type:complete
MKYIGSALVLALTAVSYQAVAHDNGVAASSIMSTPKNTLDAYRSAIESLDDTNMSRLFTDDSLVFENGKAEGNFGNYLAHHLGPELGEFESFTFSNLATEMSVLGETAIASETYTYTIVLKDGRTIERQGVATAVLVKRDESWKIAQYHSSSRTPKK